MITVTDLTKRYARHTAVDHISFEVHKGFPGSFRCGVVFPVDKVSHAFVIWGVLHLQDHVHFVVFTFFIHNLWGWSWVVRAVCRGFFVWL